MSEDLVKKKEAEKKLKKLHQKLDKLTINKADWGKVLAVIGQINSLNSRLGRPLI